MIKDKLGMDRITFICFAIFFLMSMLLLTGGCSKAEQTSSNAGSMYTVTDVQGYQLQFKEKPQRIISMSISTDEILIDLVDIKRIAAFSRLVDDPGISNIVERAQAVSNRVNGQSSEAIMALQPDLILVPDFAKPEVIQSLRDMDLRVYVYKTPKSMDEVKQCIRLLAEAVDEKEHGAEIIAKMEQELQQIQNRIGEVPAEKQRRIVFLRTNGAYYSPEASFNDVCRLARVRNALAEAGYDKPVYVSQEEVVRLNPDCFILSGWNYDGRHDEKQVEQELLHNPAYATTNAIKNKQVITLPGKHLQCVSQYLVYAVDDMVRGVYGK